MAIPSTTTVNDNTVYVIQRATLSALELANFPLSSSDVNSAFAMWEQDLRMTKGLSSPYREALIIGVHHNLLCLGFQF